MIPRKDWFDLAQVVPDSELDLIDVIVQGVPFDDGVAGPRGSALAPERLRATARTDWPVTETGEIIDRLRLTDVGDVRIGKNRESFHEFIDRRFSAFPRNAFLLHLGGDHSVSIPLIQAFGRREKGNCGVLLLDAHPDLWDDYEGQRFSHACVMRRVLESAPFSAKRVALVGLRSFSREEIEFMQRNNLFYITARDFQTSGAEKCATRTIDVLYELDSIYLSLDIDVFDPAFAPGTGFPVAGGLSPREVLNFLKIVFSKLKITAMDLVEISPPLDTSNITLNLGCRLVLETLGFLQARKTRFSL
ncbi:MAG TPA: agmatinase [Acidobacteriota bacterium]|jgi:agmatinase